MLDEILTLKDCKKCKKCCKFEPDELIDAPMFGRDTKDYIDQHFGKTVEFKKKGKLFQIILKKIPGKEKFICPLLDDSKGCVLGEKRPFDCQTRPFYIMRLGINIVITLSPSCPVVNDLSVSKLREYVRSKMGPYMLAEASKSRDLITEYHDYAVIIDILGEENNLFS